MSDTLYQFGLNTLDYIWQSIGPTSITVSCISYIYIYYYIKFSYWRKQGINTPRPIPWFGTAHYPLLTPKPELELELHRKYGKIYGLYDGFLGTNPTLVCGHPEAIKQVTIKHFEQFTNRRRPATWKSIRYRALTYLRDDEWREMRRILAPTFTGNKLRRMFELMKKCTQNLQLSIQHQGSETEIDLKRLFSVFTVDIISTCCFSMDLKDFRDPESEMLISARKFFNVSRPKMAFYMALPKPLLAYSGFDINDNSSIEFFARFAQEVINTRRKFAINPNSVNKKQEDFLQILIDAAEEFNSKESLENKNKNDQDRAEQKKSEQQGVESIQELKNQTSQQREQYKTQKDGNKEISKSEANKEETNINNNNNDDNLTSASEQMEDVTSTNRQRFSERQLGDLEILAQSMLFFAVGHETTATLLSSCGLFLSLHPELQDRLYNEVHEAMLAGQGQISYENLMELKYLDAFISEALRFFTPTLNFDREASEDVEIEVEGKRIMIPKGMGVVIPFHAVHHDPANYEDPERFDPERFMPENKHKIKPCTFIPFGSGPRYCLASRFALIEAKLALATLVNKFRFVRSEGTIWPPKYRHHYMLLQMEWPKIRFVDRKLESSMTGLNGRAQMAA